MNGHAYLRVALIVAGAGLLVVQPALAGVPVRLGPQAWQASDAAGFTVIGTTTVKAPAGSYGAGAWGGFSWCTPYAASSISSAAVRIIRYHQRTTVRAEVGPTRDGSLGPSQPESTLPQGAPGASSVISGINSACVGARVRQTGTQQVSVQRIWDLLLDDIVLSDNQGPSIDSARIEGPQTQGWYTGPVTAVWSSSDNALLRGTTGASVVGSPATDRGDAPNGSEQRVTLDPGADGLRSVRVYRTGTGGWGTAERTIEFRVDQTPPSVPLIAATPTTRGPGPIALTASGSTDSSGGSGLARYEFTVDNGRTLLRSTALTQAGAYEAKARAVDFAGNASAWSLPLQITVTSSGGQPAAVGGMSTVGPAVLPDLTGVRLARLGATRPAARVRTRKVVQLRPVWNTAVVVVGRFVHADGTGLRGTTVVVRNPSGAEVGRTVTQESGTFRVRFRALRSGQHAIVALGQPDVVGYAAVTVRPRVIPDSRLVIGHVDGRPLIGLAPGRRIVVAGIAQPANLVGGRRVRLEYLSGGQWLALGVPAEVSLDGKWTLSYTVARAGSALVTLRASLEGGRGLGFATGRTASLLVNVS